MHQAAGMLPDHPDGRLADDRIIDERAARHQIIDISSDHQIR